MKCLERARTKTLFGLAAFVLLVAVLGYQVVSKQDAFKAKSEPQPVEAISYTTLDELATALADEGDVVLVEFCVPSGCSRCDQMRTSIDQMAVDQQEWLKVHRVNLRQHLQLMVEFNLSVCPSYIAFRDGEEVFRASYPASADLIATGLDEVLNRTTADQLAHSNL